MHLLFTRSILVLQRAQVTDAVHAEGSYLRAASNAMHTARFDRVEIRGANGYLVNHFLQTTSNTHTDRWSGDEEGRTQLAREVVEAVVDPVGLERVGISPWSAWKSEICWLTSHITLVTHGLVDMPTNISVSRFSASRQACQASLPPRN